VSILALLGLGKVPTWAVELVAVLALVGSGILYFEHKGATHELAKLQVSSTKLLASANATIKQETDKHAQDVANNQSMLATELAANDALRGQLDQRLRDFDAYRRAHPNVPRPAPGPTAPVAGECGARSCGDVVEELAMRGDQLAADAADVSAALRSCQRDRDALTGLPK